MSAQGFVLGLKGSDWSLVMTGDPPSCRNEFKRLCVEDHEYAEVLVFDTYSSNQPRKRRRFKKNLVAPKKKQPRKMGEKEKD